MSHAIALLRSAKVGRIAAWRARRLTTDRKRERLAAGLERTIAAAEAPPQSLSSAVPVRRSAVLASRWQLLALAQRLRAPAPVYAQGVALVAELLSNADSPPYQADGDLDDAVLTILAALDGNVE
jgi:hypothetical protein